MKFNCQLNISERPESANQRKYKAGKISSSTVSHLQMQHNGYSINIRRNPQ